MMLVIVFHFFSVPNPIRLLLYHLIIIIFLLWITNTPETRIVRWFKNFNPLIIIPTSFHELHYLVHNVNPVDFDQLLINIDYAMFGVHPTIWLEKWAHPVAVEYFQIIYTTFYFLPIILAYILFKRKKARDYDYFLFLIVFGFYLSYIFYFLVPAVGPRFTLNHLQTFPVEGLWLTEGIRQTLDTLENIQRDAFPSGHTAITLVVVIYAWKYSKPYFWILTVVGSSLLFSTVYLRYHYVVDVIAGILLTLVMITIARPLFDWLCDLRKMSMNELLPKTRHRSKAFT